MHYIRMNCSPVIVMLVDWLLPCSFLLAEDDQVWSHSMNVAEIQNTYRQLLNNEEKIHIIFSLEPYEKPLTFNNWCFIFTFQSKYISLYCWWYLSIVIISISVNVKWNHTCTSHNYYGNMCATHSLEPSNWLQLSKESWRSFTSFCT